MAPINITSADQANKLDVQNRYNTLSGLSSQMLATDPNQLRIQRTMSNLSGVGAVPNIPINTPTTVNPTSIGGIQPLTLTTPTPSTNTSGAGITGAMTSKLDTAKNEIAAMEKQAVTDAASTANQNKANLWESITGKKQIMTDQANAINTPEMQAKLKTKNDFYAKGNDNIKAQQAEIQAVNDSTQFPDQKAQAISQINNKYAFSNAQLSISYDIANNDYNSALNTINETAKLKMDALQPEIDYYSAFLSSNEANLTKAQQAIIQSRKDALTLAQTQAGDTAKQIGALQIQASQNGAPADVINAIGKATDLTSAVSAMGQYGQNALDVMYKQEQIKTEQAQRAKIYADAAALNNPSASEPIVSDPNSASILAQTGLSLPAFAYLTQGTTALTRMTAAQRLQYINEAENFANTKGIDISTFKSQYGALSKTVEANTLRNNQSQVAESELNATIENLKTAATESGLKSFRWGNVAKLYAGKEFNDADVSKYAFHLNQLREEFAMYNAALAGQIDANGNIRETSDADRKVAENIIKDGMSNGGIEGFANALEASRSKMATVLQSSIDAQNKQVWSLFGVGQNFKSKTPQAGNAPLVQPKEGDTKLWEGKTFKLSNGVWTAQ